MDVGATAYYSGDIFICRGSVLRTMLPTRKNCSASNEIETAPKTTRRTPPTFSLSRARSLRFRLAQCPLPAGGVDQRLGIVIIATGLVCLVGGPEQAIARITETGEEVQIIRTHVIGTGKGNRYVGMLLQQLLDAGLGGEDGNHVDLRNAPLKCIFSGRNEHGTRTAEFKK
jgi:hypothetical protein